MARKQPTFRQIEDLEQVRKFVNGGNAVFTLVSKRTENRFTFRVRNSLDAEGNVKYAGVQVMHGSDNTKDYTFMGLLVDGELRPTRNNPMKPTDKRWVAFTWFLKNLKANNTEQLAHVEFWHSGRCAACGRLLTVPASIDSGFGPECSKRAFSCN